MAELTTSRKIALARTARALVMLGRRVLGAGDQAVVHRGGIKWDLDLREGIDFAIYLLGGFEVRTLRLYARLIRRGDTVLDIGANIGAHTLPFAKLVGSHGRVVAFEPTQYAFGKLQRNLALNPELASRVSAYQVALLESRLADVPRQIYSSWPLEAATDLHSVHGGKMQSTQGAHAATLDQMVEVIGLERVNFIKVDVDGHEPEVLAGALETIGRFRPRILLEWAPYLFEHKDRLLEDAMRGLRDLGYRAYVAGSAVSGDVPKDRHTLFTPLTQGASVNLLLEVPA